MANCFLTLPQELQIQILSNLDAVSLIRCAMTCKVVYETLRCSSLLVYIVQLHFDGLKDTGMAITHSDLILRLLDHRQAWSALELTGYRALDMDLDCQAYELVGGAFATTNGHHFEIVWLPTASTVKERKIERTFTGICVRDFAMDPTQDVIALLDDGGTAVPLTATRIVRIHIRTISTNVPHPLARQSPLQFTIPPDGTSSNAIHNVLLQLARNTLILSFHQDRPRVIVWNWPTSDVIWDSSFSFGDPLLSNPSAELGLLNSTFCFTTSLPNSGSIQLYKFLRFSTGSGPGIHVATLHLPPVSYGTQVIRISAHAGPVEAHTLQHLPFMVNDDDRLHVFTVRYIHPILTPPGQRAIKSLNLFVHQRTFTKYCKQRVYENAPLDVPWSEWGPPNTRIISPARTQPHWLRFVYGQRVVFPLHSMGHQFGGLSSAVEVLDFSLASVLSAQDVSPMLPLSMNRTSGMLMPSSKTHPLENLFFQETVETRLPYVSSVRNLKGRYSAYMIHEDGIVGVNTKEDDSLLLHVYNI